MIVHTSRDDYAEHNEIKDYLNYLNTDFWEKYAGITEWDINKKTQGITEYSPKNAEILREINIAVNICTYHRREQLEHNLQLLKSTKFFDPNEKDFYGHLHIFITDNGREIEEQDSDFVHIRQNRNTGGSGGFQKGLEEIRRANFGITHVVFMDDDVSFLAESFYRLYGFLCYVKDEYVNSSVAGRMFCLDDPCVQYTASEIWNKSSIEHLAGNTDMRLSENYKGMDLSEKSEYSGWWFCCYPYEFAKDNDVLPFFIHCDDVEYGLRFLKNGGGKPIVMDGVQVWHETYVYRQSPQIQYYDMRNPLFVNEIYGLATPEETLQMFMEKITLFHNEENLEAEYFAILGMMDYLKGMPWLKRVNGERLNNRLKKKKTFKYKNSVLWRIAVYKYKKKIKHC